MQKCEMPLLFLFPAVSKSDEMYEGPHIHIASLEPGKICIAMYHSFITNLYE